MKYVPRIFLIAGCLALIPLAALAQVPREYQVKAAFIYNFVKFVEWPDGMAVGKQKNINICVIGNNPFGDPEQQIFQHASTPSLRLSVVEKRSANDVSGCHIVFISQSEEGKLPEILGILKSKPVLTVSDIDNFAYRGGIIGFVSDDNKVKLIVNTNTSAAAGLRVDAQLLEIAQRVIRE